MSTLVKINGVERSAGRPGSEETGARRRSLAFLSAVGLLSFLAMGPGGSLTTGATAPQRERKHEEKRLGREEREDYFQKWLQQDVVYIISEEEKTVFQKLTQDEEKEEFIEQFWQRRDPDPRTAANEFKDELYRRIAYANERFTSALPGWKTDRGRIYIIHGAPVEIESHPAGGTYQRPDNEGGGFTSTYPFEKWRYRYLEGIGSDVEIEFVDPSGSGEYRLALRPEEKDALLYVPGAGLTLAEEMGLAKKSDRPFFSPGNRDTYPLMPQRVKDSPFQRYETYVNLQRPKTVKYPDLKKIVEVDISYNDLPFKVREDYFKLNRERVLVPITLEIENRDLSFKLENGAQVARVAAYGVVTSITNRLITEFEEDLEIAYPPRLFPQGRHNRSAYQKIVPVDASMRYKIDLVVKDLNSGRVGVIRKAIIPPSFKDRLTASSLILSDSVREIEDSTLPGDSERFVLGKVKVRPSLNKSFRIDKPLVAYLQVYNAGLDQATLSPALSVEYSLFRQGRKVLEVAEAGGESIQFFSAQRIVLIQDLEIRDLQPGHYHIQLRVTDSVRNQKLQVEDDFQLQTRTHTSWPPKS
ncbi:MAG: GWxTD domain-containing protein [Acidobacteriota bacterium]